MNRLLSGLFAGALCLTLTVPVSGAALPHFKDVPAGHWAYEMVEEAYDAGAIVGVGQELFDPSGSLTQAQFMAVLVRAVYPDEVKAQQRQEGQAWYAPELAVARAHGLLANVSQPNTMNGAMSRYDMAAMVYDLLRDWGAVILKENHFPEMAEVIPDYEAIPARYQDAVRAVYALEIIQGMDPEGNFRGGETMTRAHGAAVYCRLAGKMGLGVDVLAPELADYADLEALMAAVHELTPLQREGYLTNGKPISGENIAAFLTALEQKFPDGSQWTKRTTYQYSSPKMGQGRGEAAFAAMVSDWMFGEAAPVRSHRDYDAMKPGDVLLFQNLDGAEHYWVITGTDADRFYAANGDADGRVSWKSFGGLAPLRLDLNNCGSLSLVMSRY